MKLPFLSRSSHEAILSPLSSQVEEMKQERKLLLDRLFSLGLGGPLFSTPEDRDEQLQEEAEELIDEVAELKALRSRPTKLADALTRKAYRDFHKAKNGPSVKWIPDITKVAAVTSALDQAEKQGKERAN